MTIHQEDRYKVPDRFSLIPAGPGEFRLHSLTFSLELRDSPDGILSRLIPLLDGARTVREIAETLDGAGLESVCATVDYLIEVGALERVREDENGPWSPAERERLRPQLAFFSHFVAPADAPVSDSWPGTPRSEIEYQARLVQAHVVILGLGRIGSDLARALALAGVGKLTVVDDGRVEDSDLHGDAWFAPEDRGESRAAAVGRLIAATNTSVDAVVAAEPGRPDAFEELFSTAQLVVLCRDHFDPSEYEAVNAAALAARTRWTSARLSGFELHVGPTVVPFETSCFRCFDLRLKSNVPDYAEHRLVEAFLTEYRLGLDRLAFTPGAGLLALEAVKAITWFMAPATCDHLFSLDLLSMQSKLHPVLKIPRCPACGRASQSRPTINAWQQSTSEGSS